MLATNRESRYHSQVQVRHGRRLSAVQIRGPERQGMTDPDLEPRFGRAAASRVRPAPA
jgi:hypothetical protein